jgi:hypothetical protein
LEFYNTTVVGRLYSPPGNSDLNSLLEIYPKYVSLVDEVQTLLPGLPRNSGACSTPST